MFDLSSISSKTLNREFRSRKEIPPTAQAKFKEEYPSLAIDLERNLLISLQCYLRHKFSISCCNVIVMTVL